MKEAAEEGSLLHLVRVKHQDGVRPGREQEAEQAQEHLTMAPPPKRERVYRTRGLGLLGEVTINREEFGPRVPQ
jgi:hypothetical protein